MQIWYISIFGYLHDIYHFLQGLAIPMVGGLGLLGNIAAIVVLRWAFILFMSTACTSIHYEIHKQEENTRIKTCKNAQNAQYVTLHALLWSSGGLLFFL